MLATMIDIDAEKASLLICVIEPENFERMRLADPITMFPLSSGGVLATAKYPANMRMIIAYEEDVFEVHRLFKSGGTLGELIRYLERGYTWKEDRDGMKNGFRL